MYNLSNNRKIEMLKEQKNELTKLIDLGLTTITSVYYHEMWQAYSKSLNNNSVNNLKKDGLTSSHNNNAIKIYGERINEAKNHGLIKKLDIEICKKSL